MPTIKVTPEQYKLILGAHKKLTLSGLSVLPLEITKGVNRLNLGSTVGLSVKLLLKKIENEGK